MSILENDIRRRIVNLLRDGELSAGQISEALERPRPGISHHLALLAEARVVVRRLAGPFRYYRLDVSRALAEWDSYLAAHVGLREDAA